MTQKSPSFQYEVSPMPAGACLKVMPTRSGAQLKVFALEFERCFVLK